MIFQDSLINKKVQKSSIYLKTEIICNIINVFTVALNQFNISIWMY